jgi:hypothetical protein
LLRVGKLDGLKVGLIWLVNLNSRQDYFRHALNSKDLSNGP